MKLSIKQSKPSTSNATLKAPPVKTDHVSSYIQGLCQELARGTLKEVRLGFSDKELMKRDLKYLGYALQQHNCQCIESFALGWRLQGADLRLCLQKLVPLIVQKSRLKKLHIVLDTWIPESTLWRLLEAKWLSDVTFHSTRITRRAMSDPRHNHSFRVGHRKVLVDQSSLADDDNIAMIVPFLSEKVQSLTLQDCDLQDEHVLQLVQDLKKRTTIKDQAPITHLSLRHNRHLQLDHPWCKTIFSQLPHLQRLDLSLCDLDAHDGSLLAQAIAKAPTHSQIQSLSVAGNYRLAQAMPTLVAACLASGKIQQLDCSFCDVQSKLLNHVFRLLGDAPRDCPLKSFICRGSRIHNASGLLYCVQHNTSLQSLVVNHKRETYPISKDAVIALGKAMQSNTHLRQLLVDCELQYRPLLAPVHFYLKLNQCGRQVLEEAPTDGLNESTILKRACQAEDPNVWFWFLRNGVAFS